MGGRHGGRRGEAHPAALPGWPHLARTPHLVDEAVVYQLSSQVLGTVGCGRGGGGVRPAVLPTCSHPHPGATFTPWPTWEQVVGELPMQPVLQHQEQSELRRRRQEGVVGSRSALSLFSRTRCLCQRQAPPPPPSSRASAPGPRSSPGYTASGSPAGKMQAKVTQRLDLNLWQQG